MHVDVIKVNEVSHHDFFFLIKKSNFFLSTYYADLNLDHAYIVNYQYGVGIRKT